MKILLFVKDVIIKKYLKEFVRTFFLLLLLVAFDTGAILMLAPFIDMITKSDMVGLSPLTLRLMEFIKILHLPRNIYSVMGLIISFSIFRSIIYIWVYSSVLKIKYVLFKDMICETFKTFFDAQWRFFIDSRQGVLGNTFIKETTKISESFHIMGMLLVQLCQLGVYFGIAFFVSWQLSLVIILLSAILVFPFLFVGKLTYKLGKISVSTANKIYEIIQEYLSAAKLVIGYNEQEKGNNSLGHSVDSHVVVRVKSELVEHGSQVLFRPVGMVLVMLSFLVSKILFEISLSELAVVMFALYTAMPLVGQSIKNKNALMNLFPSYEQLNKLTKIAEKAKQPSGEIIFKKIKSEMTFKNVAFRYPGQDQLLQGVNLSFPRGKMIALVGKSGTGKTTIIDLILRFFDPNSGSILVDNTNLNEIDVYSWRKRIGYVPQDSFLFNVSIRENLLWSKEDATEEQIQKACSIANVDEFLKELPKGLDTMVGDRGVFLSGGQRQRIALARAILREPEILILDEATSSLDSHSEKLIQRSIEMIARQTTVVVVAHRLSTVINADIIYVLDNGNVVEEGNFAQLSALKGKYYELAKIQGVVT